MVNQVLSSKVVVLVFFFVKTFFLCPKGLMIVFTETLYLLCCDSLSSGYIMHCFLISSKILTSNSTYDLQPLHQLETAIIWYFSDVVPHYVTVQSEALDTRQQGFLEHFIVWQEFFSGSRSHKILLELKTAKKILV